MSFKFLFKKKTVLVFWIIFWLIQSILMSGLESVEFYLVKNIAIVSLQFLIVTVNTKLLFPILFERKKYLLYIISCLIIIYIVFAISYPLIGFVLSIYFPNIKGLGNYPVFLMNFWQIIYASSFYSLALLCSTVFNLLKANQAKDKMNRNLKDELEIIKTNTISIKEGHTNHIVLLEDIYFIKGLKEYVVWHTKSKNIIVHQTLNSIEIKYKEMGLLRVHKSYIVNTSQVKSYEKNMLKINDKIIPVGRVYKSSFLDFFSETTRL